MSLYNTQNDSYSQDILPIWKHAGETLAVLIERFRTERGLSAESKITYAGRLDPMAEGVVLMLVGDARFEKDTLLDCEKTYELTILLGVSTDTADMLGLATIVGESVGISEESINKAVHALLLVTELRYPRYSSRTVEGIPLFTHARRGTIVDIPIKKVTVSDVNMLSIKYKTLAECIDETVPLIETVEGDFRQADIIRNWRDIQITEGTRVVPIVTLSATVTSGTYMRALAEVVGKSLGVPALAYRIKRTTVGHYVL